MQPAVFWRFFQMPPIEDEDLALRGRVVHLISLVILAMTVLVLVGNALEPEPSAYVFVASGAVVGVALVVRWLLWRGQVYWAGAVWVTLALLIVTVNAVALGTVRSSNTAFFVVTIAVTGLLLGRRAVLIVMAYSTLAVAALAFAENNGWLQVSPVSATAGVLVWANYTAIFGAMAAISLTSLMVLEQSVAHARRDRALLARREVILQAIAFAAQQLLESDDWRERINDVLACLGQAMDATHAYIFERHFVPEGYFALSQRYEWVRTGFPSEIDKVEYQKISLAAIEAQAWYFDLSHGQVMTASLLTCESDLAEYFAARGIKSILEIPIMASGQWWGVLGFNDFAEARAWSDSEIETITIAASTLGLAIQRQRTMWALHQRDLIMKAAAYAAGAFLASADWRAVIQDVLARLGEAVGASHVYLFENHLLPDGREGTSQRYEWVAPDCQPDIQNPLYQNMPIEGEHTQHWIDAMRAGNVYYCNLNQFSGHEYEIYLKRRLFSYIEAPIHVKGVWWGVLGMDDNYTIRDWTQAEVDAFRVAASTLANAIQRQMQDEAHQAAEREYREKLEQRVQERTQQLQEALQEIEGVSFTASHDLRAPLRAVDGYASILLAEHGNSLTDEQVGYIQKIKQASQRMAHLLDDLIRLIRYSRQPLKKQLVDLSALARQAVAYQREKHPLRAVQVHIAPDLVSYGDRELLSVVIGELFDNAWKFTEDQPRAEIQFDALIEEGRTVFFLKDNGIGIDMTYAGKLFRNFEQLHQPGVFEGTGMGLSTVNRIIQRHGGKIWVEGKPNEGATFFFWLPGQEN